MCRTLMHVLHMSTGRLAGAPQMSGRVTPNPCRFRTARLDRSAAIPDCHPPAKARARTLRQMMRGHLFCRMPVIQVNSSRTSPYVVGYLGMFAHQRRRTCHGQRAEKIQSRSQKAEKAGIGQESGLAVRSRRHRAPVGKGREAALAGRNSRAPRFLEYPY